MANDSSLLAPGGPALGEKVRYSEERTFVIESPWVLLAMPCTNQLGADRSSSR